MTDPLSLEAFLERRGQDRRLARLTHDVPLPKAVGLEFGAATNPTMFPNGFEVEYVDYARDANGDAPDAVAVDHVWTGAGSFAEICGHVEHYQFAIAAQVAQYVPNLLGWFRGIFEVLRPGGVLNLSLPDRRFMFDIKRAPSTLGELVEAFYLDYSRPSIRQVFDHTFGAAALDPAQIWANGHVPDTLPRLSGEFALGLAHRHAETMMEDDRYITCHCWVFTPLSFLDLIEGASRLGLFPFVISQFGSTEAGQCEFYVCLRRDAETDAATLMSKQLSAISYVRDIAERRRRSAKLLGD